MKPSLAIAYAAKKKARKQAIPKLTKEEPIELSTETLEVEEPAIEVEQPKVSVADIIRKLRSVK